MSNSPAKHSPCRLDTYLSVHANRLAQAKRSDLIREDTISVETFGEGSFILQGEIACQGNIVITVCEILDVVAKGEFPEVFTSRYTYNVRVLGQHNVLRYDNCHRHHGHPDSHHKHIFNVQTGDGATQWVGENSRPTLPEVIEEVREWWSVNQRLLESPFAYPSRADLKSEILVSFTGNP